MDRTAAGVPIEVDRAAAIDGMAGHTAISTLIAVTLVSVRAGVNGGYMLTYMGDVVDVAL